MNIQIDFLRMSGLISRPDYLTSLINYSCQDLSRCRGRHQAPRGEGEGPRARRPHRAGAAAEEQGERREGEDYYHL